MKIENQRSRLCGALAVLLWLNFMPLAQAFYNPSTGKWLSRDPIREVGFTRTPNNLKKSEKELLLNSFVANNPVGQVDFLGLKAEAPRPAILCQDPCKWAREHNDDPSVYGITVCCNGKKYGCIIKDGGGATDPLAKAIINECIQFHEDLHAADPKSICRPRCGWTGPLLAEVEKFEDQFQSECASYRAEINCLNGKKTRCNGDSICEAQVDAQIESAQKQADYYCRLNSRYPAKE